MAEQGNGIPGRNLVAIDVARYRNAVLVETAAGKRHRFKMANTAVISDDCSTFWRASLGHVRSAWNPPGTITVRLPTGCSPAATML